MMDVPQPPQDEELKNIIDKLAVFVARNGPEFESMTKQKQQDNPRFGFLYGGEFFNYYMYRVTSEQAILKHKAQMEQRQQPGPGPGGGMMGQGPGGRGGFGTFGGGGRGFMQDQGNPFQQQSPQQQMQPRFPFGQQQQMMQQREPQGPGPGGPRHMSRFDRGPPGGMPPAGRGSFQNFERPQMRMSFEQQQYPNPFDQEHSEGGGFDFDYRSSGPPPRGGGGGFERGGSSFERGPPSGFDRGPPPMGSGGFERGAPSGNGGFERGPPGGGGFDRGGPPPQSHRGPHHSPGPSSFDPHRHRNRFDVGPPPGHGGFDGSNPPIQNQGFTNSAFQQQPQAQNVPTRTPTIPSSPGLSNIPSLPPQQSLVNINQEIETSKTQKQNLEEQINQSEQNLLAQNQVLMTQQQNQIDEALKILQTAEIKQLASDLGIDLVELDSALQPIVDTCTKEAISGGKAWIFTHTSTPRHYQLLSMYLLRQTTDSDSSFSKRLHIIYLVNDVLHHCMRKGAEDLRQVLEAMVIPMFSHAKVQEIGNEEGLAKLDKLLSLWESKCQYVSPIAVEKLKDSNNTWLEYHGELLKRHAVVVTQIAQNVQKTYEGYQAQHQMFTTHNLQNIQTLDQKIQQLIAQKELVLKQQQLNLSIQNVDNIPRSGLPPPGIVIPSLVGSGNVHVPVDYPVPISSAPVTGGEGSGPGDIMSIPDISRPPPGFSAPPIVSEKDLMPALPYYELPAGLMVPLVKLEDDNYKPLDPSAIRLPPPCPPSDRLIQAVEAFYAPPSHERPRDSEGWERLGLYEYFKSKNLARKQKEDDIRQGKRDKSKSPSPLRRDSSPSGRSPPRRRYQSKSPTPLKRRRSKSPPRRKGRRRSRSRSRSRSPIRRSPTPPSFGMPGLGIERKLDESNKGHQLLKKMGWGGSGLGANEQGIEAPITGGEVREKNDQYRGVGVSANDPFESYRKSKGQAFVERMRARAEDRP